MTVFKNIKELIKTLDWSRDLLSEMFEKRNTFSYKFDMAVMVLGDVDRVEKLIETEIIRKNGSFLEIDEKYLDFFELVLEVNEQISTAFIQDNIQQVKDSINFYLKENKEDKQYSYLKQVKSALQKIGRITTRSIIDLNRNIDNTFKTEPNYKIKLNKLENFDLKRMQIKDLIEQTDNLITTDELTFFTTALDVELNQIVNRLRLQLVDARHNISETHNQIIEYINQTKHKSQLLEKVKQVKYLRDMFELKSKTNFEEILMDSNAVLFTGREQFKTRLSLEYLQTDQARDILENAVRKFKTKNKATVQLSEAISDNYLQTEEEQEQFIHLEDLKRTFTASGNHLYDFIMNYNFSREVDFSERVTLFCKIVSIYDKEFEITEKFGSRDNIEFAIIYPK
ncbi:MAG: hypothetical protein U0X41_05895 [Chitinophagales bacterium]|jgi:hypothetical protein